jgi:hypothetical protein
MTDDMAGRTAHPYDDTEVIDSRAPRTNQAVIGSLALLAFLLDLEWLPPLLALQLAIGLTFGRRYCLPCLLYFEVIQPRFGEGRIEDARPPRFATAVGTVFLAGAGTAFLAGVPGLGWALTLTVAGLALLAASTGLCLGCEAYVRLARLRRRRVPDRIDPVELDLPAGSVGVVAFSSPYCLPCQRWERALTGAGVPFRKVDISERPELARRYSVSHTPLVLAVRVPEGEVVASFADEPAPDDVGRLRQLALAA